jgi:hypothetical protein
MNEFHPRATRVVPSHVQGAGYVGVPWKLVIHTTESDTYTPSTADYFGHQHWPHATVVAGRIFQHLPISRAARALARADGVETNRANAIQCEVVWRADRAQEMPDELVATLADWLDWAAEETGCPLDVPRSFRGAGEGIVLAVASSPHRFTLEQWLRVTGIVGHQHVPVNDHFDPGRLPVDRLNEFLKGGEIVDPTLKQLIVDLHTAMTEEKEGRLPQPRLDALQASIEELKRQVAGLART